MTLLKELIILPGVRTVLLDSNKENISNYFADFHVYTPPVAKKDEYIDLLRQAAREFDINFIIPATQIDIQLLAELKSEFLSEGIRILVPDTQHLNTFLNKRLTYINLASSGVPCQELLDPEISKSYPLIAKPVKGFGGKGIQRFNSITEYQASSITLDAYEYVFVKFLPTFDEYSVDFSVNCSGETSEPIVRRRIMTSGGFAVVSEVALDLEEVLDSTIGLLLQAFNSGDLSGIYNAQILVAEGMAYVSDLNPRVGTSAVVGKALSRWVVGHAIDHVPSKPTLSPGVSKRVKCIRFLEEKFLGSMNAECIKGVVFDLDDTLISNAEFIKARCGLLFHKHKELFPSFDQFELFVGFLLDEGKASVLIDEICGEYQIQSLKDELLRSYQASFPDTLHVFQDVYPALKFLKDRKYTICILTDNPVRTQKVKMDRFEFANLVDHVVYTNELGLEKPHPETFHRVCEVSGLLPSELIMVGDNLYRDCIGAKRNGYSASFHIQRTNGLIGNTMFNDNPIHAADGVFRLSSLRDLRHYLLKN